MKIYTKKGDTGKTQLLGGKTVSKDHIRLECYGALDELNAHIGNIYDQELISSHKKVLMNIQNQLFKLGSCIAYIGEEEINLPNISQDNIDLLENEIDSMDACLPELKSFILPSGNKIASKCHIARTVCRRAERKLIALSQTNVVDSLHIKFINRLSDYLFMLARHIIFLTGSKEVLWQKD